MIAFAGTSTQAMKISIYIHLALCIAAMVGSTAAIRPFKEEGSQVCGSACSFLPGSLGARELKF